MILIGIDPSFSGTGISVEWNSDIILQAELSSKLDKKKTKYINKLLIDITKMGSPTLHTIESTVDNGDMQRIIDYHLNLYHLIDAIVQFVHVASSRDEEVYICIEIPMGTHMGAGAKIDRCYAAALLAIHLFADRFFTFMYEQPITMVSVYPKTVKKLITNNGNAKKDAVQQHLLAKYKYKTNYLKNFNISDSFAILQYLKFDIRQSIKELII